MGRKVSTTWSQSIPFFTIPFLQLLFINQAIPFASGNSRVSSPWHFQPAWGLRNSHLRDFHIPVPQPSPSASARRSWGRSPTTEDFLGLLVQVGDGDAGGQDGVVGVLGGQRGCSLCGQSVQLHRGDPAVEPLDHLHGDLRLPGEMPELREP